MHPTAKVSDQVNRKCNFQLPTPTLIPQTPLHQNFQIYKIFTSGIAHISMLATAIQENAVYDRLSQQQLGFLIWNYDRDYTKFYTV